MMNVRLKMKGYFGKMEHVLHASDIFIIEETFNTSTKQALAVPENSKQLTSHFDLSTLPGICKQNTSTYMP